MDVTLRKTFLLCGLHPFSDPPFEFLDGIATNGKLENVKRHGFSLATAFVRINRPMPPAPAPLGKSVSVPAVLLARAWLPPALLRRAAVQRAAEPMAAAQRRIAPGARAPEVTLPAVSFQFRAPGS